jgi:hypothetical protein
MIVRDAPERWILITQPDHAQLSGLFSDRWRGDEMRAGQARSSLALAVREHDNGWLEADTVPLLDERRGRPHDFRTVPDEMKRQIWPRGIRRLAPQDPYAAALVAQHGSRIHELNRERPGWKPFFEELDALLVDMLARWAGAATI